MDTKTKKLYRTRRKTKRTKKDRLSRLPDDIILHILSLLNDTKIAVQTCVLSKRWRNLWTHLPSLNFDSGYFENNDLASFKKFVGKIKARRKVKKIQTLRFWRLTKISKQNSKAEYELMDKIIGYAMNCGLEELETNNCFFFNRCVRQLPPFRSIKIQVCGNYSQPDHIAYDDQIFASVTRLHLEGLDIVVKDSRSSLDLFSGCDNLEKLTLINCRIWGYFLGGITISCPNLVNLTVSNVWFSGMKLKISAPSLLFLDVLSKEKQKLLVEGCPDLQKLKLCYKDWISGAFCNSNLQDVFQNDVRCFVPMVKSLVVEYTDEFKMVFMKRKNCASFKIYHTIVDRSVATLTCTMEAESESHWNEVDFGENFLKFGFITYPTIIYTLNRHESNYYGLDDTVKKEIVRNLIMSERSCIGAIMSGEDSVFGSNKWKCGVTRTLEDEVMWEIDDLAKLKRKR